MTPSKALRQEILARARCVVVKLGTQLLTRADGSLDIECIGSVAGQVSSLSRDRGLEMTIVSSGAVGIGLQQLHLDQRPEDVATLQAAAAAGQSGLMNAWSSAFAEYDLAVAQILLTRADLQHRERYLNIRHCISRLHDLGAIPIVNENDAVSVDEIKLGDNDVLAAAVANALPADALLLLTGVDGLKDAAGRVVEQVDDFEQAQELVSGHISKLGSGGMATKLAAARMLTDAGEIAVIANGRTPGVITDLLAGRHLGTVFVPAEKKLKSRARWIAGNVRPSGRLLIDDGAVRALVDNHKSLLAKGILQVDGRFYTGELVSVCDRNGVEIARGSVNFDAQQVRQIMGRSSEVFHSILGYQPRPAVIERHHLVLTRALEQS